MKCKVYKIECIKKACGHFRTISRHKWEVLKNCFRVGLYSQGLLHDLSKYSLTEFRAGAKYYTGLRSPNIAERLDTGVSLSWLHHKGRNRHHFEYWYDYDLVDKGKVVGCRMPYRFVAEMFCDRVAAAKVYKGKDYTDASPWEYYSPSSERLIMHDETRKELVRLLLILKNHGEDKAFRYLKREVKSRRKSGDYYY